MTTNQCPGSGARDTFSPSAQTRRSDATGKASRARVTCKVCGRTFESGRVTYTYGQTVEVPRHKPPTT